MTSTDPLIRDRVHDIVADQPTDSQMRSIAELQKNIWLIDARPEQIPPPGDWRVWYLMAGRGAGKTRAGAETLARWEGEYGPGEFAIIAPTFADGRDTCVEAPQSGLISILGPRLAPGLEPLPGRDAPEVGLQDLRGRRRRRRAADPGQEPESGLVRRDRALEQVGPGLERVPHLRGPARAGADRGDRDPEDGPRARSASWWTTRTRSSRACARSTTS